MAAAYANPIGILDAISSSHRVNEVVKETTGFDPFGTAASAVTGDWSASSKAGAAFGNVGRCLHSEGMNVAAGITTLEWSWDGLAADAAGAYFRGLAESLVRQGPTFEQIAVEYERAARGVWLMAENLSGVLKMVVDKAIIVGIAAAARTASF